MNKFVFDASALLILYFSEPGKNRVKALLDRGNSLISTINLSEVISKVIDDDTTPEDVMETVQSLDLVPMAFDAELAMAVAAMSFATRHLGLSLADRACIALAAREQATAVTADRSWTSLPFCRVELVR